VTDEKALEGFVIKWASGIKDEIAFWHRFCENKGAPHWVHQYEYLENAKDFIRPGLLEGKTEVDVLDVGCGAISQIGNVSEHCKINVNSADPLAPAYEQLYKHHKLSPYSAPVFALGERLTDAFEHETFDIVTMTNALDHSFSPMVVIKQMLMIAKTGGFVYLQHQADEAEYEKYSGFHQWNVNEDGGDLILWRQDTRINATKELSECADTVCTTHTDRGRKIICCEITKKSDPTMTRTEIKQRHTFDRVVLSRLMYFASDTLKELL